MKKDWKGSIDWFIYCERILRPLLVPFALAKQKPTSKIIIIEHNVSAHKYYYMWDSDPVDGYPALFYPAWCDCEALCRRSVDARWTQAS